MNKATVALTKCNTYNASDIDAAFDRLFNNSKSLEEIIPKDAKNILIKVSCLKAAKPETAINTHPEILRALIKKIRAVKDIEILVGDSCIGTENITDVYKETGIEQICSEEKVKLINFEHVVMIGDIPIAKEVLEADALISLPKVKTHCLTNLTCAVKTTFGIVPGLAKINIHKQYPDILDFSATLCEIFNIKKPIFSIADGILSMEGTGPVNGNLRNTKFLAASTDSVALDAVVAEIIGLLPKLVPTTIYADKKGYGIGNLNNIEVTGCNIKDIKPKNFKLPPHKIIYNIPSIIFKFSNLFIGNNLPTPNDKCTLCLRCVKNCPKKAISKQVINGKEQLVFDAKKCILCLCCIEMCPENALYLKQSPLLRTLSFTKKTVLKFLGLFKS